MLLSRLAAKRPGIVAFCLVCLAVNTLPPTTIISSSLQQVPDKPHTLTDPVPRSQIPGVEWFEATGHTLRGSFLDYWQKNGGLAQFGYPITEAFFESSGPDNSPVLVQYFERNRFEHHPVNGGTQYEVLLGTLGREFHPQDAPAPVMPAPALYFPETGHNLSGTFKAYWETHGGLPIHGYPITEQFVETNPLNGRTYVVQYFERSRFELHPENAGSPYEVLLGQLGTQLSQKRGYPYGWYPTPSHAADMSWISGYLELYEDRWCFAPWCGCSLFRYSVDGQHLQLNELNGDPYPFSRRDVFTEKLMVVFGRMAKAGEEVTDCTMYADVPIYLVERVQSNPAD